MYNNFSIDLALSNVPILLISDLIDSIEISSYLAYFDKSHNKFALNNIIWKLRNGRPNSMKCLRIFIKQFSLFCLLFHS